MIQFLYHGWREHELEIRFHTTLTRTKWNKVIILASKLKKMIFFLMTSFLSLFDWDYLAYRSSIFSQILICYSWDNSLQEIWHLFFILMMASQSNVRLKATMHNFSYLCVMSMGDHFFSKHESAWQCSLTSSSVVIPQFSPKFQYVVAETISYR